MNKKSLPVLLVIAVLSINACFALTPITTITTQENLVNVDIEVPLEKSQIIPSKGLVTVEPITLNTSQKLDSIVVYFKKKSHQILGPNYFYIYFDLSADKLDQSILRKQSDHSFGAYFSLYDTSKFIPQKSGTTSLEYLLGDTIIDIPIIVTEAVSQPSYNNVPAVQ